MEVVELKVRLHCKDCEKNLRRVLNKIKGVTCVEMNVTLNKITVMGYIDKKSLVTAIRKTGRRVELWSSSKSSSSFSSKPSKDVKRRVFGCIYLSKFIF